MSSIHEHRAEKDGRCGCCQTPYKAGDPVCYVVAVRSIWIAGHVAGAGRPKSGRR